ncbi:MAG: hypothetical protein ACRELG_17535, partial [Gemmataceae bacterium]
VPRPVASWSVTGFSISGRLASFAWCNEAETASILAARIFASQGFEPWIAPRHARSATISNGQSTWQAPFRLLDLTNLSWRTENTKERKHEKNRQMVVAHFRSFVFS